MFKDTPEGETHFDPAAEEVARLEDYIKEVYYNICNWAISYPVEDYEEKWRAYVKEQLDALLTEARKKRIEEEIAYRKNIFDNPPKRDKEYTCDSCTRNICRIEISRLEAELTKLKAYKAYCEACIKYHGEFANLGKAELKALDK